jgi:hypothetical protein
LIADLKCDGTSIRTLSANSFVVDGNQDGLDGSDPGSVPSSFVLPIDRIMAGQNTATIFTRNRNCLGVPCTATVEIVRKRQRIFLPRMTRIPRIKQRIIREIRVIRGQASLVAAQPR